MHNRNAPFFPLNYTISSQHVNMTDNNFPIRKVEKHQRRLRLSSFSFDSVYDTKNVQQYLIKHVPDDAVLLVVEDAERWKETKYKKLLKK